MHADGCTIDKLVRIGDIEGATEKEVVVSRVLSDFECQVVEQVVSLVRVWS